MKKHHSEDARGHKHAAKEDAGKNDVAPEEAQEPEGQKSEVEQFRDRLLRLQADFDNYRRRTARERIEFGQRATEDLVSELLPVLDHFELGLKNAREHSADAAVREGFQLVYDQLMGVLKKAGLAAIEAEGQLFDPHQHEAVTHLPSNEVPADVVIHETRRGYRLGDKLLRAAQVVVSSGPADEADAGATDWGTDRSSVEDAPRNTEAQF